jgi:hypothetical protein
VEGQLAHFLWRVDKFRLDCSTLRNLHMNMKTQICIVVMEETNQVPIVGAGQVNSGIFKGENTM